MQNINISFLMCFKKEAKILTFSAVCRCEDIALEDKIAEVFRNENLRTETN